MKAKKGAITLTAMRMGTSFQKPTFAICGAMTLAAMRTGTRDMHLTVRQPIITRNDARRDADGNLLLGMSTFQIGRDGARDSPRFGTVLCGPFRFYENAS